jgi:beta-lactamase class A
MDNYAGDHAGKVSLYARHLRSGRKVPINPDLPANTASAIKFAIMLETMYQVKQGRVSFDDVLPLRNRTPSED